MDRATLAPRPTARTRNPPARIRDSRELARALAATIHRTGRDAKPARKICGMCATHRRPNPRIRSRCAERPRPPGRPTFANRFPSSNPFQERFVAGALLQVDAAGLLEGGGGAIRMLLVDHRETLAD